MTKSNALSATAMLALAKKLRPPRSPSLEDVPGIVQPRPKTSFLKTSLLKVDLTGCARTGLEKAIARIMAVAPPEPLLRERNLERQRLLFRAYYVPTFAAALIGASRPLEPKSKKWEPPWWLIDHAIHLVSFERMFLEGNLCDGIVSSGWTPRSLRRRDTPADLPQLTLGWFPHDSDQIRHLEARLDEWRRFAWKSVKLYLAATACREIETLPPSEALGAMMGAIEDLTPLPVEAMPPLLAHLRRLGPKTVKWFHRAASEPIPSKLRKHYDLDNWLIEVQPLTMRFGWKPHNLFVMARCAFGKTSCLRSEDQLRNRMRDLGLRSSEKASKTRTPAKATITKSSRLTQMESIAVFIQSIGETERHWMLGTLGLTQLRNRE